jgi:hypothetical protein
MKKRRRRDTGLHTARGKRTRLYGSIAVLRKAIDQLLRYYRGGVPALGPGTADLPDINHRVSTQLKF